LVSAQRRLVLRDLQRQHILQEGKSYLKDEKGKDYCKYIMFSGNVDQDGDRTASSAT
jgi:hypothetical protein